MSLSSLIFHLFHNVYNTHVLRWQLLNRQYLTPLSYNSNVRYNPRTGIIERPDIRKDRLTGIPSVSIRETFQIGFGDFCYITDQLVRPINNLWKGIRDPIPTSLKRLPRWILKKYFPLFYSGNFSAISHTLEEVGNCNTECFPIPKQTMIRETEQGRRQLEAFAFDEGFDFAPNYDWSERQIYEMWSDLNQSGYCSPYVTQY